MKNLITLLAILSTCFIYSCGNQTASTDKKVNDSSYSGLEGTRDDASQLSNSTIDTAGGQSMKKKAKDSSFVNKDSSVIK